MPTFPYFDSGYLPEELRFLNYLESIKDNHAPKPAVAEQDEPQPSAEGAAKET